MKLTKEITLEMLDWLMKTDLHLQNLLETADDRLCFEINIDKPSIGKPQLESEAEGGMTIKVLNEGYNAILSIGPDSFKEMNESEAELWLFTILRHELCHLAQFIILIEVAHEYGYTSDDDDDLLFAEKAYHYFSQKTDYWSNPLEKYAYSFQEFGSAYEKGNLKTYLPRKLKELGFDFIL